MTLPSQRRISWRPVLSVTAGLCTVALGACAVVTPDHDAAAGGTRWWKGNTHTHTLSGASAALRGIEFLRDVVVVGKIGRIIVAVATVAHPDEGYGPLFGRRPQFKQVAEGLLEDRTKRVLRRDGRVALAQDGE